MDDLIKSFAVGMIPWDDKSACCEGQSIEARDTSEKVTPAGMRQLD